MKKVYETKNNGLLKVIKYINYDEVTVEFLSTKYVTTARMGDIKKGMVKDLLSPSVYSVGFIGEGEYKPTKKGRATKAYKAWSGMLERCYSEDTHKRSPSYKGCSVCSDWHNFQTFSLWFHDHYKKGMSLDKDILIKGNKVYSPSACKFVSREENTSEATGKSYILKYKNESEFRITNLTKYCKKKGINVNAMFMVLSGVLDDYNGWTAKKSNV